MTKQRSKHKSSQYKIWIRPAVHTNRKKLPGHLRQRIRRTIDNLSSTPRPAQSKELRVPDDVSHPGQIEWEVRRIRLDDWRIVYAINESWLAVAVLAIHKRPPYDYEDLDVLLSDLY